jgi:hypothetical protein
LSFPAIAIGGHLSVYVGDRLVCGVWRRAPSGEQASRPLIDSRQQPFCNFVSKVVGRPRKGPDQTGKMGTKPRISRALSRASKMRRPRNIRDAPRSPAAGHRESRARRPPIMRFRSCPDRLIGSPGRFQLEQKRDFRLVADRSRPIRMGPARFGAEEPARIAWTGAPSPRFGAATLRAPDSAAVAQDAI